MGSCWWPRDTRREKPTRKTNPMPPPASTCLLGPKGSLCVRRGGGCLSPGLAPPRVAPSFLISWLAP